MPFDPKKHVMPTQDPAIRATNFKEVALGYSPTVAKEEALRCLNCPTKPCVAKCPVHIDIPAFIKKIKEDDLEGAYSVIAESSSLPAVCGRVCPQERQCESACTLGIKFEPVGIGRLERFVADYHNENSKTKAPKPESNGHKVAVVGSGPSGLACASDLAKQGFEVTIYEALHKAGGVLIYGIPEFRLPKKIVAREIEGLKDLGVDIQTNVVIGKTITIDELFEEGYEAIFIGSGAGLPKFMGIPGESLKNVFSANEFLTRINLMGAYLPESNTPIFHAKKVAVVGGGNVAMDAARSARRLGAEVSIVYRRTEKELPARVEEVEHAKEEGIKFELLTNPIEILGNEDGSVSSLKCIRMELGEPDASGRRSPIPVKDSDFVEDFDCVIMALGTSPNPLIKNTTAGIEVEKHGCLIVNEEEETTRENVFAGGDAVTGAATVILAMGAGKKAAASIAKRLLKK